MGSESSLWKTLYTNMKPFWEAERIENAVGIGVPDVYATMNSGRMVWIELKHVHYWPKKETTQLKIKHYTPQQRSFIRRHGKKGANVYILLQVERDYFLLTWQAALRIGEMVPNDYYNSDDIAYWKNRINYEQLIDILS